MKRATFILLGIFFTMNALLAQEEVPKVFMIGEHEEAMETIMVDYQTPLLQVCDNDPQKAYNVWSSMLDEMEAYADIVDYDLDGIKAWFRVCYATDGTLDYIAYHLRPQSRNVDTDELAAFLTSFSNYYKLPMRTESKYNNYTGVQFPTFKKIMAQQQKNNGKN